MKVLSIFISLFLYAIGNMMPVSTESWYEKYYNKDGELVERYHTRSTILGGLIRTDERYWVNNTIGGGTSFSKTSNGTLTAGDTLFILPGSGTNGNYTGGSTLTNLAGAPGAKIVVLPSNWAIGGRVLHSGTISANNNKFVDFSRFSAVGNTTAWNISGGNNSNDIWHQMFFKNISGSCFQFGVNKPHTYGDTTTLQMYKCVFDSLYISKTGQPWTGAFTQVTTNAVDIVDSLICTNIHIDSLSQQDAMQGQFSRTHCINWYIIDNLTTDNSDKGIWVCGGGGGNFNGEIAHIYYNKGRGKLGRFGIWTLGTGTLADLYIYDCIKVNTTNFGFVDIYGDAAQSVVAGRTLGGHVHLYNCTFGNAVSVGAYGCHTVFVGTMNVGTLDIRNVGSFNNFLDAHGNLFNASSGSWSVDTSKIWRYASATAAKLDSAGTYATYQPLATSPWIGVGVSTSIITDYANLAFGPYPLGYLMPAGALPPPGCQLPDCQAGRRFTHKRN